MLNVMLAPHIDTRKELPNWLTGAIVGSVAILLLAGEFRYALRPQKREPRVKRGVRNLAVAAGAGLVMQYLERPAAVYISRLVDRRKWGLAPLLTRNPLAQTLISIAILDYGLYVWHVLTHRVPFLWRFHLVHHIDLDLDASTALRFHFGEMICSVPWRVAQIAIAGASPLSVSIWQTLLFCSILFHHSNLRLPARLENVLSFVVATPRLHGIHHRANASKANSNWSSGLALWDLIHGTWRDVDTADPIGVPVYQYEEDVTLPRCAVIPFTAQKQDWQTEALPR